jgi:hypothetical protein
VVREQTAAEISFEVGVVVITSSSSPESRPNSILSLEIAGSREASRAPESLFFHSPLPTLLCPYIYQLVFGPQRPIIYSSSSCTIRLSQHFGRAVILARPDVQIFKCSHSSILPFLNCFICIISPWGICSLCEGELFFFTTERCSHLLWNRVFCVLSLSF